MKIYSLYKNFFKFLNSISNCEKKWENYFRFYYQPNKDFLKCYFSHFPLLNLSNLKTRVEAIKPNDYSLIKNLIYKCPPEKLISKAYIKCKSIALPPIEPEVYLFIGFFSPEAFVMNFKKKPVICFGLERFKDFRLLKILFSHEYSHFILDLNRRKISNKENLKWLILSEGIGTYFSSIAFPGFKMPDYFLFRRDVFNWCQRNENYLREIYFSGKYSEKELLDFYHKGNHELNLPARAGKYLGYQAVKKFLIENNEKTINSLLKNTNLLLSLKL